jgi:hypothetical protein
MIINGVAVLIFLAGLAFVGTLAFLDGRRVGREEGEAEAYARLRHPAGNQLGAWDNARVSQRYEGRWDR